MVLVLWLPFKIYVLAIQRQIEAEKKRQQAKKGAAGKLEKLLTKRAEVHNNLACNSHFTVCYVHRSVCYVHRITLVK